MSTSVTSALTMEQLETAILLDVVTQFANTWASTPRFSLLVKYEGQPAWQALANLTSHNLIRKSDVNKPTDEEEYLPTAGAFELCGDSELLTKAKTATTVVLHTLKQMFKGERKKKEGFSFEDFQRHVSGIYPSNKFDPEHLKLGLYLAKDFNVLSVYGSDVKQVGQFQISETAIGIANPDTEWDRVMEVWSLRSKIADETSSSMPTYQWERVGEPLGHGGQSDVYRVRSPKRVAERAACLLKMRTAMDGNSRGELADAMMSFSRPDSPSELGAMKLFKIRKDSSEKQALDRLKQEFEILKQNRPGLPKLLDSNESERWIVTELFSKGTVEDNINHYKGNPALALKAFLSLVNTVTKLHDEGIVHRDIKPANVFVRELDDLVLGDFGIVYLPDQPARLTRTNESVGPHDYMPPWAETDGRLDKVETNFDVYMLGKLLWCMVTGRLVLRREWYKRPENDVTVIFRHDPHAHMINTILEKCVVERQQDCVGIHDVRAMAIAFVSLIEQGGQLLQREVPRPCHVCGHGEYEPESFGNNKDVIPVKVQFWKDQEINLRKLEVYTCNSCGHVALFKTRQQ